VRAYIDGRSELVLSKTGAHWRHVSGAAPGLWQGKNEPTTLNGTPWTPKWPSTGENRDCNCASDAAPAVPALAPKAQTVSLEKREGRGNVTVEQPTMANDFTAKVVFDDGARAPAWYEVVVKYER